MKRLTALFTFTALFLGTVSFAQTGRAGIGLRGTPDGAGFTVKTFMSNHLAFEGQLNVGGVYGLAGESFTAVALLEGHIPLPDKSWRLFFGGGVHAGTWNQPRWYNDRDDIWINDRPEPMFGIDAIGGVEYLFKKIPLGLSGDFKPAVNFTSRGPEFFSHNMVGVAARYYFR